jgi:hypothetical protein
MSGQKLIGPVCDLTNLGARYALTRDRRGVNLSRAFDVIGPN